MEGDGPPQNPACVLLEDRSGMKFFGLKKTLLFSYEPKIKIISVGEENDLDTKSIFLLGATGAGKTSLINALVNHLLGVKFEHNYRYVLNDEIGERAKTLAESQTEYVVAYLIYSPPSCGRNYNYLIIDTPGFKDSRGTQRDHEVTEQIRTFLQDVDGVDELHCIGFVVNGTIARLQDQFSDIVGTFCEIFGENAKDIIRILISFGYMRRPPVLEVLNSSSLKDYKRCKFDNVSLKACNQPNEDYSDQEITMSKTIWNQTAEVYDAMLNEIESTNAVSLGLTRDTLIAMENLHKATESMKRAVVAYLDLMQIFNELEGESKDCQTVIKANENYTGIIEVEERKRLKPFQMVERFRTHTYHKVQKEVTHEDKKAAYNEAKTQESKLQERMEDVNKIAVEDKEKMVDLLHGIVEYLKYIRENSLRTDLPTPLEFTEQFITEVKFEQLNNDQNQQGHIAPLLNDLQVYLNSAISSVGQ